MRHNKVITSFNNIKSIIVHNFPIDYLKYSVLYFVHIAKILITFIGFDNKLKNYCNICNNKSYFTKTKVSFYSFFLIRDISI